MRRLSRRKEFRKTERGNASHNPHPQEKGFRASSAFDSRFDFVVLCLDRPRTPFSNSGHHRPLSRPAVGGHRLRCTDSSVLSRARCRASTLRSDRQRGNEARMPKRWGSDHWDCPHKAPALSQTMLTPGAREWESSEFGSRTDLLTLTVPIWVWTSVMWIIILFSTSAMWILIFVLVSSLPPLLMLLWFV